jgi:hypothetical protein
MPVTPDRAASEDAHSSQFVKMFLPEMNHAEKLYQHKRRQCPNRRYWEKKMFVLKTVLRRKMRVGRNASLLQPSNKTPIRPDALAG